MLWQSCCTKPSKRSCLHHPCHCYYCDLAFLSSHVAQYGPYCSCVCAAAGAAAGATAVYMLLLYLCTGRPVSVYRSKARVNNLQPVTSSTAWPHSMASDMQHHRYVSCTCCCCCFWGMNAQLHAADDDDCPSRCQQLQLLMMVITKRTAALNRDSCSPVAVLEHYVCPSKLRYGMLVRAVAHWPLLF